MNILFTSAGRRSYLVNYFKNVIGDEGTIHVANSSVYSTAMEFGDYSVITPLIHDEAYIPFLKEYCLRHHIEAIIPLFDIDLPVLAKNHDAFNELGIAIIVSNEEVIDVCNDKWKTVLFLKENGIHTPLTYISIVDVKEAIRLGHLNFPLMIKPRWGMGSISVLEARNMDELIVLYAKTKHAIDTTYLAFESKQNREQSIIIQEKLLGQEYGLDIINDLDGNYEATIVKVKHAMRSGETDCAETVHHPKLIHIGERLSEVLGHLGNLDVDAFCMNDVPIILEMNARFGGGYPFSHMAGVNLPLAMMNWLTGKDVDQSLFQATAGIVSYKNLSIIKAGEKRPIAMDLK